MQGNNQADRPICILHLSDLHFRARADADAAIVIKALTKDIEREVNAGTKIDLIIFSGDLVNAGAEPAAFEEAEKFFIAEVTTAAGVSRDKFLICPGNHDINRDLVRKEAYVEVGLLAVLKNRSAINDFVDANSKTNTSANLDAPFRRLENFYQKMWSQHSSNACLSTPFALAHSFLILNQKVGVACLNSAWRATGEPDALDQGNLLIGERAIDQAAGALQDCDIRIAVFHHPISWLHDPDQAPVESRLNAEFDILMFGHVHRAAPEQRKTVSGDVIISQGACLYTSRDYFNGYNILKISPAASSVEISVMEYSDLRREFIPATRILKDPLLTFSLPNRGSRDISTLAGVLLKSKPNIRSLANKHLSLVGGSSDQQLDIDSHFVCPGLQHGPGIQISKKSDDKPQQQIADLLTNTKPALIFGRAEAGKTSLIHYMAVQVANGHSDEARLPLIANFNDVARGERPLWRLVRDYASEISDNTITRALLEKTPLMVFLDDVVLLDGARLKLLMELIKQHGNVRACQEGFPFVLLSMSIYPNLRSTRSET